MYYSLTIDFTEVIFSTLQVLCSYVAIEINIKRSPGKSCSICGISHFQFQIEFLSRSCQCHVSFVAEGWWGLKRENYIVPCNNLHHFIVLK
jgi:hypothetical protein